ncbi:LuxR family two component transcriptional regulator [Paenibacillus cellulosilyticus]|uniref:LuxR family two component transcriptional regulator n=1 Tax=Paenibacillus cellulosilyticus TaxID=375489 RepID=A0A2V2YX08_9BACL|nr:response regulator transcription factor [Paenibacillus cellulosilyticus]PWW06144.1 LuxR family two component transcriptional regulator [Paenibacillus cellulosilyticus]QKS43087.1 response regulator transcription factor [Paenibacillus cellulosilyticus]
MISILIVDDDPFIRESMKVILDLDTELTVAGTCQDGHAAYEFVQKQPVDVVLMDMRMQGCDGVEGTRLIKSLPNAPAVLVLTTFDDDAYIAAAIRNGANGYLLKNVPPSRIISGIKTVHEGSLLIHPDIARKLAGMIGSTTTDGSAVVKPPIGGERERDLNRYGLTAAEQSIVRHIADGLSNKEIAAALYLSEGTVKNYITEILDKLELRDRTQIAIFYLKLPG